MTQEEIDKAISFVTGDLVAMMVVWMHFDATQLAVKALMAVFVGFFGGAAGLAGKDFYQWLKRRLKRT